MARCLEYEDGAKSHMIIADREVMTVSLFQAPLAAPTGNASSGPRDG